MEDTDRLAGMVVIVEEAHMEVPICRPSQAAAVVEQVAGFAVVGEEAVAE